MASRTRQRQLGLFREKLAERPDGGFICADLFPGTAHCGECHSLELAPFAVSDKRGNIHGCCCAGVRCFTEHKLARDPHFWPEPAVDDHAGRLKAWITRLSAQRRIT